MNTQQIAELRRQFSGNSFWVADGCDIHHDGHENIGDFTHEWDAKMAADARNAVGPLIRIIDQMEVVLKQSLDAYRDLSGAVVEACHSAGMSADRTDLEGAVRQLGAKAHAFNVSRLMVRV